MKTETLNLEQLIKAERALTAFLNEVGLPRRKAYLMNRNRNILGAHVKKWQKYLQELQEKYSVDIPQTPIIPLDKYQEFKKELLTSVIHSGEDVEWKEGEPLKSAEAVFTKYEILPGEGRTRGIPQENIQPYHKEAQAEAEKFEVEVEIWEVQNEELLEMIFMKLSGDDQAALEFIMTDKPVIEVVHRIQ